MARDPDDMSVPDYVRRDAAKERQETRLLWAMRVLWAWAERHEEAAMPMPVFHRYLSKVDGARVPEWKAPVPFADPDGVFRGIKIVGFSSPEEATIALAEALFKQETSLAI